MSIELWLTHIAAFAVLLIIPGPTIPTVISDSLARPRVPDFGGWNLGTYCQTTCIKTAAQNGTIRVTKRQRPHARL
jgi:hypothetical protein